MSIANLTDSPSTIASSASAAGKSYRLGRIFAGDGRTVILPVDHGTMLGRVSGLEDPVALIRAFLPLPCDGFLLGPGVAARTAPMFATRTAPARLLTIDTYWRGDGGAHVLTTSLARAAALGVDAVKVLMPWDVPPEERAARSALIGEVIGVAEPFGLPVMVEPICLSSPRPADAVEIEADGCRMARRTRRGHHQGHVPRRSLRAERLVLGARRPAGDSRGDRPKALLTICARWSSSRSPPERAGSRSAGACVSARSTRRPSCSGGWPGSCTPTRQRPSSRSPSWRLVVPAMLIARGFTQPLDPDRRSAHFVHTG